MDKKNILTCLILVLGLWFIGKAQIGSLPDSIMAHLNSIEDEESKVDELINWSYGDGILGYANELWQQFVIKALELANLNNYQKGIGDSYVQLGHFASDKGLYEEADSFYLLAVNIRRDIKDFQGLASCFNNLGRVQKLRGDFEKAIDYYKKGLGHLENYSSSKNEAILHNNYGTALRYLGKYEEALGEFSKSLEIGFILENNQRIAAARLNIAALLQDNLKDYGVAKDSLLRNLEDFDNLGQESSYTAKTQVLLGNNAYYQHQLTEALSYYNKALTLHEFLSNNDLAIINKNIGLIFWEQGEFEKGLKFSNHSLEIFQALENKYEEGICLFQIGNIYFEQGLYKKASGSYFQALDLDVQDPQLRSSLLYWISEAYDKRGMYTKSSTYKSKYINEIGELHDQQHTTREKRYRQEEARFELEEKQLSLRHQLQKEKLDNEKRIRTILFIVMLLIAIIGILGFLFQRQKQKLVLQREEMARQEMVEIIREKELEANYAWLDGQEEARKKIGQELHDKLGSMLSMVKLHFSSIDQKIANLKQKNLQQYNKANQLLDQACEEVRHISHEMSSSLLLNFGLKAQLEALAETIKSSGQLKVELATHKLSERLPNKVEFNIYRIVQELVNNVIKHARATKLSIQVNRFEDVINIMVEDNGRGFDSNSAEAMGGMGMKNLESRVNDLEGVFNVDSRIDKGTSVFIDIPLD